MRYKYVKVSRRSARQNPDMVNREYIRRIHEEREKIRDIKRDVPYTTIDINISDFYLVGDDNVRSRIQYGGHFDDFTISHTNRIDVPTDDFLIAYNRLEKSSDIHKKRLIKANQYLRELEAEYKKFTLKIYNKYVKPGSSYIMSNGNEYLYLGKCNVHTHTDSGLCTSIVSEHCYVYVYADESNAELKEMMLRKYTPMWEPEREMSTLKYIDHTKSLRKFISNGRISCDLPDEIKITDSYNETVTITLLN